MESILMRKRRPEAPARVSDQRHISALHDARRDALRHSLYVERSWHVVLSAMAHAARRQKVLLEHTRSGLAHQDLSRPEQASDLAALLDSHSRARSRTASLLQTYIDYNFGAPDPLRGPQRLAFAWLLPVLQVLFRWRPGLALLLLHYERQTGLSFLEELAATAHRGSRPGLAELATAVHDELSQQASGMYSLLSALPLQTGPERLGAEQ